MQCIRNKISELEYLNHTKEIDIICVSEHWLTLNQVDLFVPINYVVGNVMCRTLSKNGGTSILVKNSIQFEKISLSQYASELNFEISGIKLENQNIIILSVYRSPNGDIKIFFDKFELAVKRVLKCNNKAKLIIGGDFNIRMFEDNHDSKTFLDLLRSLNLHCTNKNPTRLGSCLDNILVNFSINMCELEQISGHLADHEPLLLRVRTSPNLKEVVSKKGSNLHRKQSPEQLDYFANCLKYKSWSIFYNYMENSISLEELCNSFFKEVTDIWHYCSPLVKNSNKNLNSNKKKLKPNWYDPSLVEAKNRMLAYHCVYKNLSRVNSEKAQNAHKAYIEMKKIYNSQLNKTKRKSYENYIENSSNKCKAAWEVINYENTTGVKQSNTLDPELINNFFLNSVKELGQSQPEATNISYIHLMDPRLKNRNFFNWKRINPDEVIKTTLKLSCSKSMDYLGFSNSILKHVIQHLSEQLTFIFNQCLIWGYFPQQLKISRVVPIFKKGDRTHPGNYRPVSIVPIFSKIFESLILNQISSFFETNNMLSDCQFGFRGGKSTTQAVLRVVDQILNGFENKDTVFMRLFDLSKAFDCIPFNILIDKLEYYGVVGSTLNIFKSYLNNRSQFVSVEGNNSTLKEVLTGVPQGSVLGPFLFIVAVNDLPFNIQIDSVLYADDTTILNSSKNLDLLQESIDIAHNSLLEWFSSNKLVCNEEKTQSITFSLAQTNELESVKLLGIHLDSKLNWNTHISNVCSKLSRVIYLFWKLKPLVSQDYLRTAYFGLFQSHVSYGLLLWGHSPHTQNILLLQKKILRIIASAGTIDHCKPLFINHKILTVTNLYIYSVLIHTKTNLHNFNYRKNIHEHNTRQHSLIDIPQHRLAKSGKSFKLLCVKFFNKLPESAHSIKLNIFKRTVYTWLSQNPFYSITEFLDSSLSIEFKAEKEL